MPPQRPIGSNAVPTAPRNSDPITIQTIHIFEVVKARVLAKLEERFDPSASKRMPLSLLQLSIRTQAEQLVETEASRLPKADRERLVNEALAELLGYGPLEELFTDSAVREIMVAGPHAVIVRRETAQWVPANIRFRDEEHLRSALDKLATHADPMGGAMSSISIFDLKLPNGFRAIGIIPPAALGQPAMVGFLRIEALPASTPVPQAFHSLPVAPSDGRPPPDSAIASPRLGSGGVPKPSSRTIAPEDPLAKYRNRIVERLISKMASLGVYDLQRVEITELRKVVAAYISEYILAENIFLSETDKGRLMLEILSAMQR